MTKGLLVYILDISLRNIGKVS